MSKRQQDRDMREMLEEGTMAMEGLAMLGAILGTIADAAGLGAPFELDPNLIVDPKKCEDCPVRNECLARELCSSTPLSTGTRSRTLIDADGSLRSMTRGTRPKTIPLSDLDPAVADSIRRDVQLFTEIGKKRERKEILEYELEKLRTRILDEPGLIADAIWDQFPGYMGEDGLKIEGSEAEGFRLFVYSEVQRDNVSSEFGADIVDRQGRLEQDRKTIERKQEELNQIETFLETKTRMKDVYRRQTIRLLKEYHPDIVARMIGVDADDAGEPFLLVFEPVNEKSDQLPPGLARFLLGEAISSGTQMPKQVLEAVKASLGDDGEIGKMVKAVLTPLPEPERRDQITDKTTATAETGTSTGTAKAP